MKKLVKSYLFKILIIILCFLSVLSFFTYQEFKKIQEQDKIINASLLHVLEKSNSELKGEVLDIIQGKVTIKDNQILSQYGMDEELSSKRKDQYKTIIIGDIIITLLFITFALLLAYYYQKKQDKKILDMDYYLRKILANDYDLDLLGNEEGVLSILSNDIYKVTVMLKENNLILKEDKEKLGNDLADISHQLKTPLTSMSMMCDLLSQEELGEEQRIKFLKNIRSQLQRIEWLVTSLLKMSKLQIGTVHFLKESMNAFDLLDKASESLLLMLDLKDQTLIVNGDQAYLNVDRNWTSEALLNILKNCVEHTQDGGFITCNVMDTPMYIQIKISDNGSGIASVDLPHIFERFYRGKNSSSDSVGIGLAMSYEIITSQQGTLWVESKEQQGTTFTIRFFKEERL
ncbi:MAG: HAMP domain-containing sensor histidine kinase [Erysipelotrichaceae bacterium]